MTRHIPSSEREASISQLPTRWHPGPGCPPHCPAAPQRAGMPQCASRVLGRSRATAAAPRGVTGAGKGDGGEPSWPRRRGGCGGLRPSHAQDHHPEPARRLHPGAVSVDVLVSIFTLCLHHPREPLSYLLSRPSHARKHNPPASVPPASRLQTPAETGERPSPHGDSGGHVGQLALPTLASSGGNQVREKVKGKGREIHLVGDQAVVLMEGRGRWGGDALLQAFSHFGEEL